jgi:hypothetical protein
MLPNARSLIADDLGLPLAVQSIFHRAGLGPMGAFPILAAHRTGCNCDPTDMDFRLLRDGGFEIDLGSVTIDRNDGGR